MRNHQHKYPAGDGEDRSEDKAGENGLFNSGKSLDGIMGQGEQRGRNQHDECLGPYGGT